MAKKFFLDVIQNLRQKEEIMFYGNILKVPAEEEKEAGSFLAEEYKKERAEYPYTAPSFEEEAALWAAKTIYIAAQLILYRENKDADLEFLLPEYGGPLTPSAMLSADLCLRFIPDMLLQLKLIDAEDKLISLLENLLVKWHYSGIRYKLEVSKLDFGVIFTDDCLKQLYINRVIENKRTALAKQPVIRDMILANLGIFENEFWRDFKITTSTNE